MKDKKDKKRFQDCNKIVQIWRYRQYCKIPFQWLWIMFKTFFNNTLSKDNNDYNKKLIWRLLIGEAQCRMNWTYTNEEVMSRLKERFKLFRRN